jgi:hypothetical protein
LIHNKVQYDVPKCKSLISRGNYIPLILLQLQNRCLARLKVRKGYHLNFIWRKWANNLTILHRQHLSFSMNNNSYLRLYNTLLKLYINHFLKRKTIESHMFRRYGLYFIFISFTFLEFIVLHRISMHLSITLILCLSFDSAKRYGG